jgi:predicted outer membrane protein
MLVYQKQLEHLYNQAAREKDQEKLKKLLDEILRLLAEHQKEGEKVQ